MAATSWSTLLRLSFTSWNEDKALRLSAAIAYYAVFSIAPLLVIGMAIAGLVFGGEAATGQIYDGLKGLIGAQAAEGVQAMVKSASKPDQGWMAAIGGFVMLLLGASGVMGQLKDALNTVWGVKPKPGLGFTAFIQEKFLNFGMVLAMGFLMLASLVMSSILAALHSRLGNIFALPTGVWWMVGILVSMSLTTILLAMIFKYLPDAKVRFQDVWLGAAITAVLLEIGKAALSWYLGLESTSSAYGTAGSVVLLLLWVYYTSCIALFGAEFTCAHARARGRPIEPSAHAQAVTREERREEGTDCKGDEPRALPVEGRPEVSVPPQNTHPALATLTTAGIGLTLGWLLLRKKAPVIEAAAPQEIKQVTRDITRSSVRKHLLGSMLPASMLGPVAAMAVKAVFPPLIKAGLTYYQQRKNSSHSIS